MQTSAHPSPTATAPPARKRTPLDMGSLVEATRESVPPHRRTYKAIDAGHVTAADVHPDRESESVDAHLRAASFILNTALLQAEAVGFGDQFRGAVEEAIKQVEHTRAMLK